MNKKLQQLLASFSSNELISIQKFAETPLFNTNKVVAAFLFELPTSSKKLKLATKDIENIYKAIYPDNLFNPNHCKQILTSVYQLVLQFIAHAQLAKNQQQKKLLTKEYLYLNEPSLYAKEAKHLQNKIVHKNERSHLFTFQELDLWNRHTVDEIRKKGRKLDFDAKKVLHHLNSFYIIAYLRYACQILNLKNIKDTVEELTWIDKVLEEANSIHHEEEKVVQIYLLTYKLIKDPKDVYFKKLKSILELHAQHLDKADAFEVYIYAQNYCIRQFNGGNADYLNELFDLYKETLAKEIIINNGELSPWDYKNIVFVGLKLKAFDWTLDFVEEYKELLPALEQENAYGYNKSRIHFAKKEYNRVLSLLNAVEYTDIFYQLDAKSTLLKTYYEMDEIDSLDSLIESFKILILRSKKISGSYKTLYKNLASFTKRISRTLPNDTERIKKLYAQISAKPCADKNWLKEKLVELNGGVIE